MQTVSLAKDIRVWCSTGSAWSVQAGLQHTVPVREREKLPALLPSQAWLMSVPTGSVGGDCFFVPTTQTRNQWPTGKATGSGGRLSSSEAMWHTPPTHST